MYCLILLTLFSQGIVGFWKTVDDVSHLPRALIAIYPYQGDYYGRIVQTYDQLGQIEDTLIHPRSNAPGIVGTPPYVGLDILLGLKGSSSHARGMIVDPEKGKLYRSEVWLDQGKLKVRGKLWIFYKTQTWIPASREDFAQGVQIPDLMHLAPKIPEIR